MDCLLLLSPDELLSLISHLEAIKKIRQNVYKINTERKIKASKEYTSKLQLLFSARIQSLIDEEEKKRQAELNECNRKHHKTPEQLERMKNELTPLDRKGNRITKDIKWLNNHKIRIDKINQNYDAQIKRISYFNSYIERSKHPEVVEEKVSEDNPEPLIKAYITEHSLDLTLIDLANQYLTLSTRCISFLNEETSELSMSSITQDNVSFITQYLNMRGVKVEYRTFTHKDRTTYYFTSSN